MKKPIFKRWWFWLIVVIVIAAIASPKEPSDGGGRQTGGSITPTPGPTPTAESTPEATPEPTPTPQTTFGIGDWIELDDIKISALEIRTSTGNSFYKPGDGNRFVGVKIEVENISDKDVSVSSLLMFDAYVDDVKAGYSLNAAVAFSDGTLDGTIPSGKKLVGWTAVEAPIDSSVIELQIANDWLSSNKAIFVIDIP